MLVSQQQSASKEGSTSQDPIQTEPECQWPFDPPLDLLPDGLRSVGLPEHTHGGFDISDFNPGWPLTPNMAGQPAYHPSEINFRASSISQGFNSSIPSHMVAQQHQSSTGNHFPPTNPPLNNSSSPKLFDPTGFSNAASLAGLGHENQLQASIANSQSSVRLSGIQMLGGGHGVPTQQLATHGASIGVQSLQANHQALPLAGSPFQALTPSRSEPQATRNPPVIPSHLRLESVLDGIRISPTNNQVTQVGNDLANSGLPIPALLPDGPSLGQGEGYVRMPDWIALVKPSLPAGENVVTVRRDMHVALDINLKRLPRQPPGGCGGIKIPATASVRNFADTTGKTLLEFRVHVSGATNKRRYETVCASCEKREGNKHATPSFIDFYALHNIIEQKDGKVRVEFAFCCYPKCHQDGGYFLDVVLSEDVNQENIVAQYRLPFSFKVVAKLPQGQKRTRRQMEQSEELPAEDGRNVRARFNDFSQGAADHEQNGDPILAVNPRNTPQDGQYHEGDPSNPPPPTISPIQPPQNANGSLSPWKTPNPVIAPPSTEAEPTPTLIDVNPEQGSITGGARIWLRGMDFPAHFPLFARFGTAVVPTTFSASILLACNLPPATVPGVVDVTLSKHPQPNAPEYGTSIAKFRYVGDHAQLIPILLRFQEQGYPEFSPVLQALLTSLNGPQPNRGLRGSHGAGPREDPIETRLIEALSSLQARPKFHEIVSTLNDYHQTLAHLSILYDYPSLLGRLVEWHIDLTIADVNGLTALHCAYMKGDLDSVHILRRGGASEIVTDRLGRIPSELQPERLERFDSNIDPEADLAGLDVGAVDDIDEQLTMGIQFNELDLDNCIDSGHDQLDFEDDAPEDEKEPDGTDADSPAGGCEGDNGGVAGGSGSLVSESGSAQITSNSKEPANAVDEMFEAIRPDAEDIGDDDERGQQEEEDGMDVSESVGERAESLGVIFNGHENLARSEEGLAKSDREFSKLMSEAAADAKHVDRRAAHSVWDYTALPGSGMGKPRKDDQSEPKNEDNKIMDFTVLSKGGLWDPYPEPTVPTSPAIFAHTRTVINHLELSVPSQGTVREKWLVDIKAWEELFQEMWYLNQELEPLDHSGNSILCRWLSSLEGSEGWICRVPLKEDDWCIQTNLHLDRAIAHVRGHLGLKPFVCGGPCGSPSCTARFTSNNKRNAHVRGRSCRSCGWCGKVTLRQNFAQHREICSDKPTKPVVQGLSDSGVLEL